MPPFRRAVPEQLGGYAELSYRALRVETEPAEFDDGRLSTMPSVCPVPLTYQQMPVARLHLGSALTVRPPKIGGFERGQKTTCDIELPTRATCAAALSLVSLGNEHQALMPHPVRESGLGMRFKP